MLAGEVVRDGTEDDADEFLLELLEVMVPEGDAVAFFYAYLDESERFERQRVFAVSCLVFTKNAHSEYVAAWRKMLGPYKCFHMADLNARQGEFKGMDDGAAFTMCKKAVSAVNRHRLVAASCSCSLAEFEQLQHLGKYKELHSPYAVCSHTCMVLVGNWLRSMRWPGKVHYFFESGHKDAGDVTHLLSRVHDTPGMREAYRFRGHSFVDKEAAAALQGADLLVWEYARYQDRTVIQGKDERRSYAALANYERSSFLTDHRDQADLQELMDRLFLTDHLPEPADD